VKDLLAIGACIQNMILKAHSLGIGTCWLGEILNKKEMVNRLYSLPSSLELTAVIALGYPAETPKSHRKKIEELILKEV
jgi:nitroreductase